MRRTLIRNSLNSSVRLLHCSKCMLPSGSCLPNPETALSLWQLVRNNRIPGPNSKEEIRFKDTQLMADRENKLAGISGSDTRFIQSSNCNLLSWVKQPMVSGKEQKSFFRRSRSSKASKLPISTGIMLSDKPQSISLSILKELNPENEEMRVLLAHRDTCLADTKNWTREPREIVSGLLMQQKDKYIKFFNCPMDEGRWAMAVPSASKFVRDCICPMSSGNLSIFEHPQMLNTRRDFILLTVSGKFLSFVQSLKLASSSLSRCPIEGWTSVSSVQSSRIRSWRFGTLEKSGVLIRECEWLRLRTFRFPRNCCTKGKRGKIQHKM